MKGRRPPLMHRKGLKKKKPAAQATGLPLRGMVLNPKRPLQLSSDAHSLKQFLHPDLPALLLHF
jgi:hypothetical protein